MTLDSANISAVPFGHTGEFYIGGEWVKPSSDAMFEVIAPATEEVYVRVAEAKETDMNRAVAAARKAFDQGPWPKMTHAERADYLRAIATELQKRAGDVSLTWPNEMGITYSVADPFSHSMPGVYNHYASLADTVNFEERHVPQAGGKIGLLVREPVGVVAAIIPWNAPINLMAHKIAPALLAGCTVIIKSSPEAPCSGYIMAEIAEAVGVPPGVINAVTADRVASEVLVRHPDVDKISFTGSTAAGQRIGSICGERTARYTLELGGKSAAVIMDDFDVDMAAEALVGPTCLMNGQVCSALSRVIVNKNRHDQMVEALSARFKNIVIGDPFDPKTQLGPIAMKRQLDRIEGLLAKGEAEGSTLATGGRRPSNLNRGFYLEPTVFGNVDNNSTLAREEVFGPVLSVIPANDEAHAIELANDTIYGLNNSVFTNDVDLAYSVARQLRSGTVGHNNFRTDFSIAFGGFKQSGIGREGGTEGLLPYLESKTVILEDIPSHVKG